MPLVNPVQSKDFNGPLDDCKVLKRENKSKRFQSGKRETSDSNKQALHFRLNSNMVISSSSIIQHNKKEQKFQLPDSEQKSPEIVEKKQETLQPIKIEA